MLPPSICFVSCPTYHPALHITVLVTASLGAECKSSRPCFLNTLSGAQKNAQTNPHFDIPSVLINYLGCLRWDVLFFPPRLTVVTCYRAFFGMLLTVCCFSACRWLGRVRWAAAGFAPHARITNMSRMNLPARRVSWDGGRMMTWQVGETKTETVFVFITSFIHTPCPLPLKRFTLIIFPISCIYP